MQLVKEMVQDFQLEMRLQTLSRQKSMICVGEGPLQKKLQDS